MGVFPTKGPSCVTATARRRGLRRYGRSNAFGMPAGWGRESFLDEILSIGKVRGPKNFPDPG